MEPEVLLRRVVARAQGKPAAPESPEAARIRELLAAATPKCNKEDQ